MDGGAWIGSGENGCGGWIWKGRGSRGAPPDLEGKRRSRERGKERRPGGGWMENDHGTELGVRGHIHVWCGLLDPGDPTVIYP